MTARGQKRLAVSTAIVVVVLFVAANVHLLTVALRSQPACTAITAVAPAKRAC